MHAPPASCLACCCLKKYKSAGRPPFSALSLFSSSPPTPNIYTRIITSQQGINTQDAVDSVSPHSLPRAPVDKITSLHSNPVFNQTTISPHFSSPSVLPEKVDLNFSIASSSRSGSSPSTATITVQDFPVFTTDSNQSTWLPSSSSSLPATPAQQPAQFQHLNLPPHQQDFVLFDTPTKRHQPNRSVSQPSAIGGQHQHHHQHPHVSAATASSPHLQNQRVAQIIQATGHNTSSPAFTNRFSSPAQNSHQFYASSAPSSSVALNTNHQQNRPARPPVPLFPQSTGSVPQGHAKMIQDLDLEDFTAFEGGATTSAFSSPAMYGSASSSTTNMGTVSPQDLLIQEPFMSAPNSTALTALTSPSIYNESPEFNDNFDVSPNFGSSDFDTGSNDVWFPLFPQGSTTQAQQAAVDTSPAQESEDLEVSESTSQRRKSGGNSHSPSNRHSSVSGVNSRRRDKPLPPIIVDDPSDTIAMKRARNTLAARKSRERKAQRLEELEEKIAKLEAERDHWKKIALQGGQ